MPSAKKKPGLYANIHAKQERIAHGSGEKMRRPESPGAPTKSAFEAAAAKKDGPKRATARKTPAKKSAKRAPARGKPGA